jgi:hypothetical protein
MAVKIVFPGYIAWRIRNALLSREYGVVEADRDFPGAAVTGFETIGDARYAIRLRDRNGTRYRVTVEVDTAPCSPELVDGIAEDAA